MRVVIASPVARETFRERLAAIPGIEQAWAKNDQELQSLAPDAEVLVLSGLSYRPEVAQAVREGKGKLKFIQLLSAGYETLLAHGVPAGVQVANAGSVWSPVVAEHAMGLLLAMSRNVPEMLRSQASGKWNDKGIAAGMWALGGTRMTIVGFGSIGQELAVRARAFGMSITGVTRSGQPHPLADVIYPADRLHAALSEADVIVIAVPMSSATAHLIGAAELAVCKREAVLINVARGGVVDPKALRSALMDGVIAGAALDVTEPEPLPAGDPLWQTPNLLISPHLGGAGGARYYPRLAEFASANIARFVRGEPFQNNITDRLS